MQRVAGLQNGSNLNLSLSHLKDKTLVKAIDDLQLYQLLRLITTEY